MIFLEFVESVSMIITLFGLITYKEIRLDVNSAPPLAFAKNETLKIPSSDISMTIYRHASDESGGDGHKADEVIPL
jgi:hypothetical protein